MVDVILVEESLSESALACIAIALRRPGTRVAEARSLQQAHDIVQRQADTPPLVILGWRALQLCLKPFAGTVVGLASDVGEAQRERALRAGVRAIYDRPADWREYARVVENILAQWTPAPQAQDA
jgi:DNA-binding response OmpR family regulator